MKKTKIIYWIATIWLALGMVTTAVVQIMQMEDVVKQMAKMGFPTYFLTIIGVWKVLGSIAVLMPKFPLVKEWAYAGFFFLMTGAIASHFAIGDAATEFFGPTLLLVLTIVSWYFRPEDRKILSNQ